MLDLRTVRRTGGLLAIAATAFGASGCTPLDNALASVPIFAFMHESPGFDPYEAPRNAPPNAVPFASPLGAPPEPPVEPTDAALRAYAATLRNPYPMSEEVLAAGQVGYQRNCFVCHGAEGQGNGPVVGPGRFPYAPSLSTDNARNLSDGYIYGIIRVGRGIMQAYGARIPYDERWYIVNYVRHLQQQAAAGAPAAQPAAAGAASGRE